MANRKISVQPTSREVIENKLLAALNDEDKVGICLSKDDLEELIISLASINRPTTKARQWLADLQKLQRAAFR